MINMLRWNTNSLVSWVDSHIIDYPTAMNLNYTWSFGSAAGFCLGMQFFTGIFLAMFYLGDIRYAFESVEYIMRDVHYGWLIRYFHANGASFFFIVIYCHIFRGLYYGSFMDPRKPLWWSGCIIFVLAMGTAFIGYVLPWGAMSFWGVTVITSMVTVFPYKVGRNISWWIWGAYVVNNKTLKRFLSLHYLLPFILLGFVFVHLGLLHKDGSNNPLGVKEKLSNISFYPYFYVKDLLGFFVLLTIMSGFVIYAPNFLGDPLNYTPPNPIKTPAHIVPEWYFLAFYAILRTIPHKLGGILAMGAAVLALFAYPLLNSSKIRSGIFRPIYVVFLWIFLGNHFFLSWTGTVSIVKEKDDNCLIKWGVLGTVNYFLFFIIIGFIGKLEHYLSSYKVKE